MKSIFLDATCLLLSLLLPGSVFASGSQSSDARYLKLNPAIVVNLQTEGQPHFLQVEAQVMSRDSADLKEVEHHMPAIRHELIVLFSDQSYDAMKTVEGKQELLAQALEHVRRVLAEQTGEPAVDAVYFTNFVLQ